VHPLLSEFIPAANQFSINFLYYTTVKAPASLTAHSAYNKKSALKARGGSISRGTTQIGMIHLFGLYRSQPAASSAASQGWEEKLRPEASHQPASLFRLHLFAVPSSNNIECYFFIYNNISKNPCQYTACFLYSLQGLQLSAQQKPGLMYESTHLLAQPFLLL